MDVLKINGDDDDDVESVAATVVAIAAVNCGTIESAISA